MGDISPSIFTKLIFKLYFNLIKKDDEKNSNRPVINLLTNANQLSTLVPGRCSSHYVYKS